MNHRKFCFLFFIFFLFVSFQNIFAQNPVPANAKLERLKTGLLQAEGPVWIDSLGLLFSDIQANKIYRYSPADSSLTTYLYPSDSSNGLTLDLQGRLILTQMAKRRISRREFNGTITPLASTCNGKKFNSPNDIVVKSDGTIFFTDPDYNTPYGQSKELGFNGIYRADTSGSLKLLDNTFSEPNGICFSPDEKKLYVDDSPKESIYVFDVINDDSIANKQLFYHIAVTSGNVVDGMKIDSAGNLYCASPLGICVISPAGKMLDTIKMSENPSNCAWGDSDRKSLYITTKHSLYRIRFASATTSIAPEHLLSTRSIELSQNYPNPFNPKTTIRYGLPMRSKVTLSVFNTLGQQVATLVNENEEPGYHEVKFDGTHLASGVYFYRMQAGSFAQSRKLLLMR